MVDSDGSSSSSASGPAPPPATNLPITRSAVFYNERVETYPGENQDLDDLTALMFPAENHAPLLHVLQQGPVAAGAGASTQVEPYAPQLGAEDLLACVRLHEWDRALEIVDLMVREGRAVAGAVEAEGVDHLDIRRAHPELVILLRGQSYWKMKSQAGGATRAEAYYRNHIRAVYPNGTGIPFVDKLLRSVKRPSDDNFKLKENTRRSVMDYLKIYFPEFRHVVEEGTTRIGLFGERKGSIVRCLACHRAFRGYTPAKLRYHLLQDAAGKQAKCQASTLYIREEILAAEAAAEGPLLPAPEEGQGGDGAAGSTLTLVPPPDAAVTADGAAPPPSTAPPPAANGDPSSQASLDGGDVAPPSASTDPLPVDTAVPGDDNDEAEEPSTDPLPADDNDEAEEPSTTIVSAAPPPVPDEE